MEIHEIARWSAWPGFLCYAIAVGLLIGPRPGDYRFLAYRFSLIGWITLVMHVVIAMGVVHHWNLAEAMQHTARQTQAAVGWNWGGGVWLNFATIGIWGWTLRPGFACQPKWLTGLAQWYIAFMMFNATVVFGSRPARVAGALICLGLICRYFTPETPR